MTEGKRKENPHLSDVFDTLLAKAGGNSDGNTYIGILATGEGNIIAPNGKVDVHIHTRPRRPHTER
jgi:hypothetical protein